MSKTTRMGVTPKLKSKHGERSTLEAYAFGGRYYLRVMVAMRARRAELDMREQLAELLEIDDTITVTVGKGMWGTYTSESAGFEVIPTPVQYSAYMREALDAHHRKPTVIEHVVPKDVRLNTLAKTRLAQAVIDCESEFGTDHEITQAVRTQFVAERKAALQREDNLRYGHVRSLATR